MRFSLPTFVVLCTFIPIILSSVIPRLIRTEDTVHNNVVLPKRSLSPRQIYGNCTAANTRIRREWWARANIGQLSSIWKGKLTSSKGGLSQQVSGEATSTRSSACKINQLYTKRLLGRRADLMISNSCTSTKLMTFTLMWALSSNSNISESLAYALQGSIHRLASLVCVGIRISSHSGMWLWRRATVGFHSFVDLRKALMKRTFQVLGLVPWRSKHHSFPCVRWLTLQLRR